MAWSYVGANYSGRDKVRALVGDVDTDDQQLHDYEVDGYLAVWPNEVEAAAHICRDLAAKFAVEGEIDVQGYHIHNLKKAEFFRQRAKELFRESIGSDAPMKLASISAGGISVANKDANTGNTDNVSPRFYKQQFDDLSAETDEAN